MPVVNGTLTDFGLDPLTVNNSVLIFRASSTGLAGMNLLSARKAVETTPAANGYFAVDLVSTDQISPAATHYTVEIRYRENESRQRVHEVLPWKLLVPPAGGALADLLRVPSNPALVWTGPKAPENASPGTWWLNPTTGDLSEHDGQGWTFKANLRGPAGYNATGAAEDAQALANFVARTAGANVFADALDARTKAATADKARSLGKRLRAGFSGTQRHSPPGLTVSAVGKDIGGATAIGTDLGPVTLTAGTHHVTFNEAHGLVLNDCIRLIDKVGPTSVTDGNAYYVHSIVSSTVITLKPTPTGLVSQFGVSGTARIHKWNVATEYTWLRTPGTPNPKMRFSDGRPWQAAAGFPQYNYARADYATMTYAPGSLVSTGLAFETVFEGDALDVLLFRGLGYSSRLWIDGRLVGQYLPEDLESAGVGVGGNGRVAVKFPTRGRHLIRVEQQGSLPLPGLQIKLGDTLSYPSEPAGPRVMIQGDSFTEGGSAGREMPYASWVAHLIGWGDLWRSGSGGTGYVADGPRQSLSDRWQNDIVAQAPDVLILAHGINDAATPTPALAAAAATIIDGTLAALPNTEIIVLGPFSPRGKGFVPTYQTAHDEALEKIAAARGLQFISPIQEGWITGNGNAGAPNGTGNADLFISADTTHPTPAGHEYIGVRLAGHLAQR